MLMKAQHSMKPTSFHTEIALNAQVQHLSHMDTRTKNANNALISNKIWMSMVHLLNSSGKRRAESKEDQLTKMVLPKQSSPQLK